MNEFQKTCPFITSEDVQDDLKSLKEYHNQRTQFLKESDDNFITLSIDPKLLPRTGSIFESLEKVQNSSSILSPLQYYRQILNLKVQDQQDLHLKSQEISSHNLLETSQKLLDLQDLIKNRQSLIQKLLLSQKAQLHTEEEIEKLKLRVQTLKKDSIISQVSLLQDEIKQGKEMTTNDQEYLNEKKALIEMIEKVEKEKIRFKDKSTEALAEKVRFKEELNKNIQKFKIESLRLEVENEEISQVIKKRDSAEERDNDGVVDKIWESKDYINFFQEIEDIKLQIAEFKELQRNCISERCGLLEPYYQINLAYDMKKNESIEMEIEKSNCDWYSLFNEKEEKVMKTTEKVSNIVKRVMVLAGQVTGECINRIKSESHELLNFYKDLLNECKNTELMMKNLDFKDKLLDTFRKENEL